MGKRQQSVKEERVRIVQECIASGCDYNKIAKKYNMSYQTLYTWVKKFKEMGEVGLEDYEESQSSQHQPERKNGFVAENQL